MKKLLIILFFVLGMQLLCKSQCGVCIKTDTVTGHITVDWFPNTLGVAYYKIIYVDDATPSISGMVDIFLTTYQVWHAYTFTNINGLYNRYTFTIVPFDAANTPLNTGYTASNIFLDIIPNPLTDPHAPNLVWTANFSASGGIGVYHIDRLYNGVWKEVGTVPNVAGTTTYKYNDTILYPICNSSLLQYRIRYKCGNDNCESISNKEEGFFSAFYVSPPTRDTVSWNNLGQPVLGWSLPHRPQGVAGYKISRRNPLTGNWETVKEFLPVDSLSFTITNPLFYKECVVNEYWQWSIDSCKNTSQTDSPSSNSIKPMALNISIIDPCQRSVDLSWSPYIKMRNGGLSGYQIARQINNQPITYINHADTINLNYHDVLNVINGDSVTYFVRAISKDGTMTSSTCKMTAHYVGIVAIDTLFIETATVNNNSSVWVYTKFLPAGSINQLQLERASSLGGTYVPVATRNPLPSDTTVTFTDNTANVTQFNYYRVSAYLTACTDPVAESSNDSRPIVLTVSQSSSGNLISWSDYLQWQSGVGVYEVYQQINNGTGILLATVTSLFYNDLTPIPGTAKICYWVIARKAGNTGIETDNSVSNVVCIVPDDAVLFPNVFSPNGKLAANREFAPIILDPTITNYSLTILNKWGQIIFKSTSTTVAWNGKLDDKYLSNDVFTYFFTYRQSDGKVVKKTGTVLLLE